MRRAVLVGIFAVGAIAAACSSHDGGAPMADAALPPGADGGGSDASALQDGSTTGTCGSAGLPDCPLQAWMKANMALPLAASDFATVAASCEQLVSFVPEPAWNDGADGWATIALATADAARTGVAANVRPHCARCHTSWRTRYRSEHRTEPIP